MSDSALRRSALVVAGVSSFLMPFMLSAVNIALPAIQKDLPMDAVTLSWVATAYLLSAAVFLVPVGRLADIYGRKKFYITGMLLFTIGAAICGGAGSPRMLIASRCLQGAGSAMIFATSIAILSSVYPPNERGRVLGITVAAVYMGLSIGPWAGGLITEYGSWRLLFWSAVPCGLAVAGLAMTMLRQEWAESAGDPVDWPGAIIYAVGIVAFLVGISKIPTPAGIALTVVGILCIAGFAAWERRSQHPVMDVRLFTENRVFAFSSLAALIHYSATFAVTFLLSLDLQHIQRLSPQAAGAILMAQPVLMALFSPMAGRMSDRIEPRWIASLGMVLTAKSMAILAFIDAGTSLYLIVGCLMLLGFGFALFSSPNMNAIMGAVPPRSYGIASGTVGTMRLLGQVLSMAIATLIFSAIIGKRPIAPEVYPELVQSIQTAFWWFAFLCVTGIWFSIARGKLREDN